MNGSDRIQTSTEFAGRVAMVLNSGTAGRISGMSYTDAANAVSRATNDWLLEEWLARDERLLGSMVVSLRHPESAAEEIRRVGSDDRVVQLIVSYPPELIGRRMFRPVFEAVVECGLVLNIEAGGGFCGINRGYFGVGHPASMFEFEVLTKLSPLAQIINLIAEGVFDRYPDLRVTVSGSTAGWVPFTMALMDTQYSASGVDVSLDRLPSEYLPVHVRLTTAGQPRPDVAAAGAQDSAPWDETILVFGPGASVPGGDNGTDDTWDALVNSTLVRKAYAHYRLAGSAAQL
jgi:uncharacterized protein